METSASFLFTFFTNSPLPVHHLLIQLIYLLYLSDKNRLWKHTVSQFGRAYLPVWALSYGNINDKLCHLLGVSECSANPGPVPLASSLCPQALNKPSLLLARATCDCPQRTSDGQTLPKISLQSYPLFGLPLILRLMRVQWKREERKQQTGC